jgi:3-dehydroquinate synthase
MDRSFYRFIQGSLADHVATLAAQRENFFIVDSNLALAHPEAISAIPAARSLSLPPGEINKNIVTLQTLLDALREAKVSRRARLIGIGGGVTTDLVGLLGSLYFRGIEVAYVPTTMLAMVDAAIGGKVAVNHPRQKNLIGAFYHPVGVDLVLAATATQLTRDHYGAYGEIIKMAMVDQTDFFRRLEEVHVSELRDLRWIEEVVHHCVLSKLRLLGDNCFERDLSRELNFGHSIAHPVEDITGFSLSHGEAVAVGIAVATRVARQRSFVSDGEEYRINALLAKFGLPQRPPVATVQHIRNHLERLILQRGGDTLHYVVPVGLGRVKVCDDISPSEVSEAARQLASEKSPA